MALKIPSSLKLAQLKSLAFQCGISTSGTKSVLTDRLLREVVSAFPDGSEKTSPIRVLSIDMGIRNLAYCVLDVSPEKKLDDRVLLPSVQAWRRISVSSVPVQSSDDQTSIQSPKEAFDPHTLSNAAYMLVRQTLLPYKPACILIERQRFRSMGSPHILEWTVRVNMFESMLHAVLQTLKSEKIWDGIVVSIMPGKVGPFWTNRVEGQDLSKKQRNTKIAKLLNKGLKIDLLKGWLEMDHVLRLGTPEVRSTAHAYLEKWYRLPGRAKRKIGAQLNRPLEGGEMNKLDDLADSLLQGMAWLEWEKNKKKVLRGGIEALDL